MKKIITFVSCFIYCVSALSFQVSPDVKLPELNVPSIYGGEAVNVGDLDWSQILNNGEGVGEGVVPSKVKKPSLLKGAARFVVAKKVWNNKGKIVVLGLVSLIGIGITKSKYLKLINNPEDNEDYMIELIEDKPKRFSVFHKVVIYNYLKTDDKEHKDKLEYFIDFFNLGVTKEALNKIEMSEKGFKDIESEVIDMVKVIHNDWKNDKNRPKCDKAFYENTIMKVNNYRPVPDVIFRNNPLGVVKNDVDNHKILTKSKTNFLTSDHIPSYKAVEIFLRNKGVYGHYKSGFKLVLSGRGDNEILENNLTGILVESIQHNKSSITYGGNNKGKKPLMDSENLLKATVRDISFFAYKLNNGSIDYLRSAPYLIKRNFYLCLYPIGDNYDYKELTQ